MDPANDATTGVPGIAIDMALIAASFTISPTPLVAKVLKKGTGVLPPIQSIC